STKTPVSGSWGRARISSIAGAPQAEQVGRWNVATVRAGRVSMRSEGAGVVTVDMEEEAMGQVKWIIVWIDSPPRMVAMASFTPASEQRCEIMPRGSKR